MFQDIFFFILFCKFLLLLFRMKKVLLVLFAMEFITVKVLFFFMYLNLSDPSSLLVFLAMAASEASMGLSLMVAVLRQMGKDNLITSKTASL